MSDKEAGQPKVGSGKEIPLAAPTDLPPVEEANTLAEHIMIGLTANLQVMAHNVGVMANTVTELGKRFKESESRNLWRWATLGVVLVIGAIVVLQNRQAVDILTRVTGPAAVDAQQKAQADALQQIDCDNEVNLIVLSTNINKTLPQVPIPELSAPCQAFYKSHPEKLTPPGESTTTTEP